MPGAGTRPSFQLRDGLSRPRSSPGSPGPGRRAADQLNRSRGPRNPRRGSGGCAPGRRVRARRHARRGRCPISRRPRSARAPLEAQDMDNRDLCALAVRALDGDLKGRTRNRHASDADGIGVPVGYRSNSVSAANTLARGRSISVSVRIGILGVQVARNGRQRMRIRIRQAPFMSKAANGSGRKAGSESRSRVAPRDLDRASRIVY